MAGCGDEQCYAVHSTSAATPTAPLPNARASGRSIGTPGAVRVLDLLHREGVETYTRDNGRVFPLDRQGSAGAVVAGPVMVHDHALVPANAVIRAIYVRNTTANAVTGGINVGTAAGGAQVASAIAVAGNALVVIDGASLVATGKYLSGTLNTVLYISAVTAWNNAALDIRVQMDQ